jgi:hypothetical protein
MNRESNILNRVRLAVSRAGGRLFRNNVGLFTTINGDKIRTGLTVGSADLIGWSPMIITQEMVGRQVAVFLSIEIKTAKGRPSKSQIIWRDVVLKAGGVAGIARSGDEALAIIQKGISSE